MNKAAPVLLMLAIAGVYFLGSGITGLVIGETCCFPPDCAPENVCNPEQFNPAPQNVVLLGTMFMGIALMIFVHTHKKKE